MLWGSTLAAGAEAFRRHGSADAAIGPAIAAARRLVSSFSGRAGCTDCRDIARVDFRSKLATLRYLVLGGARRCFGLAEAWTPEALHAAGEGLAEGDPRSTRPAASCAAEAARRLGATDRQAAMVAGFAGGVGLSGGGCGALAAAVWLRSLAWLAAQADPRRSPFDNPGALRTLQDFRTAVGPELRCDRITGRRFASVDEHTDFVRAGGCRRVLDALAGAPAPSA